MPKLLSLEDWIKAYICANMVLPNDNGAMLAYLSNFAQKLLTAAVADKLLQEALKPEPEDGKQGGRD